MVSGGGRESWNFLKILQILFHVSSKLLDHLIRIEWRWSVIGFRLGWNWNLRGEGADDWRIRSGICRYPSRHEFPTEMEIWLNERCQSKNPNVNSSNHTMHSQTIARYHDKTHGPLLSIQSYRQLKHSTLEFVHNLTSLDQPQERDHT